MSRTDPKALQEFEALLATERALLRAGDVEAVIGLAPRKTALADSLGELEAATLERLRHELRRNGELMAAAATGVRAAALQLRSLTGAPGMTTYDVNGRTTTLAAGASGPVRRA